VLPFPVSETDVQARSRRGKVGAVVSIAAPLFGLLLRRDGV